MKFSRASLMVVLLCALCGCVSRGSSLALVPSAKTIVAIESGYALVQNLTVVGVADSATMNRASRVKVRKIACAREGDVAVCMYEADHCLEGESDSDGDGWCQRQARFLRMQRHRSPLDPIVQGWALDRPLPS